MNQKEMVDVLFNDEFELVSVESIEALDNWDNARAFLEGGFAASGVFLAAAAL
ncbi:hypothetical protein [Clostridium grantii]|uniref:Uncharacterized protein n=1 Tax=Clostridium grantii DSM 8605 TaxID=1121316 RepID=A0A1M5VFZ3_9CLOT|nr:hypothetical protein [Clostridium grantii]SHH74167.1 hypothetical protein SAMN02745207_02283 [Clostridium grantii DSM 8605]